MSGGVAYVIEIVVLTPCSYAALATDRSGIAAVFEHRKSVFELDHSSIGEQERRVVVRHQRG